MPVFLVLGILTCLYVVFHVGLYLWALVGGMRGSLRSRAIERDYRRIDNETGRTVRQIDELTERGVAALLAAAMEHRHGNAR